MPRKHGDRSFADFDRHDRHDADNVGLRSDKLSKSGFRYRTNRGEQDGSRRVFNTGQRICDLRGPNRQKDDIGAFHQLSAILHDVAVARGGQCGSPGGVARKQKNPAMILGAPHPSDEMLGNIADSDHTDRLRTRFHHLSYLSMHDRPPSQTHFI